MGQKINQNIIRKCKICGGEFHPTARKQIYCNMPKVILCIICGKPMEIICGKDKSKTCSPECAKLYAIKQRDSVSHETKICKWCGKEFIPKTSRDVYCRETHYQTCQICGKIFEIDVRKSDIAKTCSKQCQTQLIRLNRNSDLAKLHQVQTNITKYGVPNVMQVPEFANKVKSTNQSKYGVDYYFQSDEFKLKSKSNNTHTSAAITKRNQTNLDKYGVENPACSDVVKDKIKSTNLSKYGEIHPMKCQNIVDKMVETNLQKYGVKHPMMLSEFKDKAKATTLSKYGVKGIISIPENMKSRLTDSSKYDEYLRFKFNPRQYLSKYSEPPTLQQLADDTGVSPSTASTVVHSFGCTDLVRYYNYTMEEDIITYIKSIDPNVTILKHIRKIIMPYELDIYLPEYNLAIECNPTVTHNSTNVDPWGNSPKTSNYHAIKSQLCSDVGIQLFHIFGYEWKYKSDIIKSMLQTLLGKSHRIYARTTEIRLVDNELCNQFLLENHRQGIATASVRIGLFSKDELIAIMTFGHTRNSIGKTKSTHKDDYELIRFCSKLGTTVVGGASKLFKYFCNNYNYSCIYSYSDIAHTSGKLYGILGFKQISISKPGYVWVDSQDIAYSRVSTQKHKLKKFLNDNSIDMNLSESEIMSQHGFVRVFDSGCIKWIYKRD